MRRVVVCLMLALMLTQLSIKSTTAQEPQVLISPDGVYVYDFDHESTIWRRYITLDVSDGQDPLEVVSMCINQTEQSITECLTPSVVGAWWLDDQEQPIGPGPASWPPIVIDDGGDGDNSHRHNYFELGAWEIQDDVDCCDNKNGEPQVRLSYTANGNDVVTLIHNCEPWGSSSGDCDKTWFMTMLNEGTGESEEQYGWLVNMYDIDDLSVDEHLDISVRLGKAQARIQLIRDAQSWEWRADNEVAQSSNPCFVQSETTACALSGVTDTTGDNNDAILTVRAYHGTIT